MSIFHPEDPPVSVQRNNDKVKRALGIVELKWHHNDFSKVLGGGKAVAVWHAKMTDGETLEIPVGLFGTTESSVLKVAAIKLADRPVKYR